MTGSIAERARFDFIRYANCWEDARVLCEALEPRPGQRLLSIASGGDNSFALLATGAEVVAADLSPAQLALVELKSAAIRRLELDETLAFLGFAEGERPLDTYQRLRDELSEEARHYWDENRQLIADGVVHQGKFERYFHLFRRRVLPLIHGRRTVLGLLEERDQAARERFYRERWDTLRWRLLFRVFFSRFVMGRLGRDREFFAHVEGSVAERIMARARYALTVLPTHCNPYLEYILTGTFGRQLPRYLQPDVYPGVRDGLDRLTLFGGPVEAAAETHRDGGFDGFNLSDIFEYLDPSGCEAVYRRLLEASRPGARLAYWNMLVPRSCPPSLAPRVRALAERAQELHLMDQAFFYQRFVLEEVQS